MIWSGSVRLYGSGGCGFHGLEWFSRGGCGFYGLILTDHGLAQMFPVLLLIDGFLDAALLSQLEMGEKSAWFHGCAKRYGAKIV